LESILLSTDLTPGYREKVGAVKQHPYNVFLNKFTGALKGDFTQKIWEEHLEEARNLFNDDFAWILLKSMVLMAQVAGYSELVKKSVLEAYEDKARKGDKESSLLFYNYVIMADDEELLSKFEEVPAMSRPFKPGEGFSDEELRQLGIDPKTTRSAGGGVLISGYYKYTG